MWQLNSWILPSRTYQKSAVGMSSLAPVGWITPAGVSNGPRKVPPDRQLDRDDVPEHVDPVQLPVNVGKQLAHVDDHIAQSLTPVALRAGHTAEAGEHTVLGEQVDETLDVEDITLCQVVGAADERFGVGCHRDLLSGYRSEHVQAHLLDGGRSSPDSGDIPGKVSGVEIKAGP